MEFSNRGGAPMTLKGDFTKLSGIEQMDYLVSVETETREKILNEYRKWIPLQSVEIEEDPENFSKILKPIIDKTTIIDILTDGSFDTGHSGTVIDAVYSGDKRFIATCGMDCFIIIWQNGLDGIMSCFNILPHNSKRIKSMCFSPDSQFLASSDDKDAIIWNVSTGTVVHCLEGHSGIIESLCWSSNGEYVVTATRSAGRLWSASSGILINRFLIDKNPLADMQSTIRVFFLNEEYSEEVIGVTCRFFFKPVIGLVGLENVKTGLTFSETTKVGLENFTRDHSSYFRFSTCEETLQYIRKQIKYESVPVLGNLFKWWNKR